MTSQYVFRRSDVTIRFSAMSVKTRKSPKKRFEKALREHQYTLHLEADPGDHSGLLRSPPWDYFYLQYSYSYYVTV